MKKLKGKVAFITGGARGQGRSHAVRVAELGADVIVIDICAQIDSVIYPMGTKEDLEETARLVEKEGGKVVARQADVRDRASLDAAVEEGLKKFGHIDLVSANAGMNQGIGPEGNTPQAWTDGLDVMLTGVHNTIEACLPTMLERDQGGSIVFTGSTTALKPVARGRKDLSTGLLSYAAAKHGVVGLMKLYANGLAPHSIRVNTVHPTGVNTPMVVNDAFAKWIAEPENAGVAEYMQNALPVQMVEPIDISNAVAWLFSDEARYVTGISLPVDAGFAIR